MIYILLTDPNHNPFATGIVSGCSSRLWSIHHPRIISTWLRIWGSIVNQHNFQPGWKYHGSISHKRMCLKTAACVYLYFSWSVILLFKLFLKHYLIHMYKKQRQVYIKKRNQFDFLKWKATRINEGYKEDLKSQMCSIKSKYLKKWKWIMRKSRYGRN